MKYPNFIVKSVGACLIGAILIGYNSVASSRAQLVDENSRSITEINAYNKTIGELMNADNDEAFESASKYRDGSFEGSAQGFGGEIRVSVTIEADEIKSVTILEAKGEDSVYLSKAEEVIERIIGTDSADVDSVSGATFSSTGIINAVADALLKAEV